MVIFEVLWFFKTILEVKVYFGHFKYFNIFWSFCRFQRILVILEVWVFFFWSFYWCLVILRFQVYFVHFLDFSNVEVYFLIILDVWGISVMYRDLTAHSSRFRGDSVRFWGYFSYFRDFGSIFGHFKIFWVF